MRIYTQTREIECGGYYEKKNKLMGQYFVEDHFS